MQQATYDQHATHFFQKMTKGGVLLTTQHEGKANTMTMGWGSLGFYWGKPVVTVPVRVSRFTHRQLAQSGVFTLSVPQGDELAQALGFCGSKSGRDMDKIQAAGLTLLPGRKVDCPVIAEGWLHLECKVASQHTLSADILSADIDSKIYGGQDYHTLFMGEIVDCYTK